MFLGERIQPPSEVEPIASDLVRDWVRANHPGEEVTGLEWRREGTDDGGVRPIRGGSFAGVAVVTLTDGTRAAVTVACGIGYRDCRTVEPSSDGMDPS